MKPRTKLIVKISEMWQLLFLLIIVLQSEAIIVTNEVLKFEKKCSYTVHQSQINENGTFLYFILIY